MPDNQTTGRSLSHTIGGILIAVGLLLFFIQRAEGFDGSRIWPFFVIVPGAALWGVALMTEFGGKLVAGIGAAIAATGLLLLYQNAAGHFQSWAYAWALVYPAGFGAGWYSYGIVGEDEDVIGSGKRQVYAGLAIFAAGLIVFEFIIGISGFSLLRIALDSILWPLLLIAAGAVLVVRSRRSSG